MAAVCSKALKSGSSIVPLVTIARHSADLSALCISFALQIITRLALATPARRSVFQFFYAAMHPGVLITTLARPLQGSSSIDACAPAASTPAGRRPCCLMAWVDSEDSEAMYRKQTGVCLARARRPLPVHESSARYCVIWLLRLGFAS